MFEILLQIVAEQIKIQTMEHICDAISKTFSDAFSWIESFAVWLKFHFFPNGPLDNKPALV